MKRVYPSIRQVIWFALAAIAKHPLVQSNPVYYPIEVDGAGQAVPISRYRAYGGLPLENLATGVTLSIYPAFAYRDARRGSHVTGPKAVEYKAYNLGVRSETGIIQQAHYRFIVEVSYNDSGLSEPKRLPIFSIDPSSQRVSSPLPIFPAGFDDELAEQHLNHPPFLFPSEATFDINPGEEVLRDWVDVIRLVLQDYNVLSPFAVRSSEVVNADFPSSAWSEDANVFFHQAYLVWEVCLFPPTSTQDLNLIRSLSIKETLTPQIQDS